MRIYVAGGFLDKVVISGFMRKLEAAGHTITCDWTKAEAAGSQTSDADLAHEEQHRFARLDLEGVRTADVVWHIVANYKGSRGAYIETGYALALRDARRSLRLSPYVVAGDGETGMESPTPYVIVSGTDARKSIFHALANALFETDHDAALAHILRHFGGA